MKRSVLVPLPNQLLHHALAQIFNAQKAEADAAVLNSETGAAVVDVRRQNLDFQLFTLLEVAEHLVGVV